MMATQKRKWFERKGLVILWLILFWPAGLIGLLRSPCFKKGTKTVLAVIFGLISLFWIIAIFSPAADVSSSVLDGVKYSIISEDTLDSVKRSLDVRLEEKVSEEVLEALAYKLRDQDSKRYDRTFINYYLPDMEVGKVSWAITHFDPDLRVQIVGLTSETEEMLRSAELPPGTIGAWLDESPLAGGLVVLYEEDGKVYYKQTFYDGSEGTREMVREGNTFTPVEAAGNYWVINENGELECRDTEGGLIYTAKRISG